MKLPNALLLTAIVATVAACSSPTGQQMSQRMQQTQIGQKLTSPEAIELKDRVSTGIGDVVYESGEALTYAQQKFQIARFPAMQPVIVRQGTNLAPSAAVAAAKAPRWDSRIEHRYIVELADGKTFTFGQSGPQFYQNQMATLLRNGLTVTLIH